MTLQELIERETAEQTVSLWSESYTFTPALLTQKFGDGQKLCYLMNIDSRPLYWLFLADSNFDPKSQDADRFIQEELEPEICDEFGCYTEEDMEGEEWNEEDANYPIYFRDCSGFFVREVKI